MSILTRKYLGAACLLALGSPTTLALSVQGKGGKKGQGGKNGPRTGAAENRPSAEPPTGSDTKFDSNTLGSPTTLALPVTKRGKNGRRTTAKGKAVAEPVSQARGPRWADLSEDSEEAEEIQSRNDYVAALNAWLKSNPPTAPPRLNFDQDTSELPPVPEGDAGDQSQLDWLDYYDEFEDRRFTPINCRTQTMGTAVRPRSAFGHGTAGFLVGGLLVHSSTSTTGPLVHCGGICDTDFNVNQFQWDTNTNYFGTESQFGPAMPVPVSFFPPQEGSDFLWNFLQNYVLSDPQSQDTANPVPGPHSEPSTASSTPPLP